MRIDKKLNLVVPLSRGEETIYVHSMPIGREVFEKYYLVMAKTFSSLMAEGLNISSGPRVAAMMLKSIAEASPRRGVNGEPSNWLVGDDGVANGLLNEVRRLSNVVLATPNGWETLPLAAALDRNLLDPEEVSEVENQLAFFTVCSLVAPREDREGLVTGGAVMYNSLTTLSNSTEYAASLKTSRGIEDSGKKATRSSAVR